MLTITMLPGEPLVIVQPAGPCDRVCTQLSRIHRELDQVATRCQQGLHVVVDARYTYEIRYSDVLLWLDMLRWSRAGTPLDARLRFYVVSTDDLVTLALRKANRQFGLSIAQYSQLELALTAIRHQIGDPAIGGAPGLHAAPHLSTA